MFIKLLITHVILKAFVASLVKVVNLVNVGKVMVGLKHVYAWKGFVTKIPEGYTSGKVGVGSQSIYFVTDATSYQILISIRT